MELTFENKQIVQPDFLSIELMQHQKAAIYAMNEIEKNKYVDIEYKYFNNVSRKMRLNTKIGILGDRVGSGKTLTTTTYLLHQKNNGNFERTNGRLSTGKYVSVDEIDGNDLYLNVDILIVPRGIQHQWKDCFDNHVNKGQLKYINVENEKDADKFLDFVLGKNKNIKTDIVLISDKTVDYVLKKCFNSVRCRRVIIDEADTVSIKGKLFDIFNFDFCWLVTGTTNGISTSKKKMIKDMFGN